MTEKTEDTVETLPDLDDLLQCPVCYEIPSGQIFQCNEGHHVCGRCKMRLDVCPVCRAFFFGTRNYAMEELIANVRKLRAFKLGGKVTTGSPPAEETSETRESSSEETEFTNVNINDDDGSSHTSVRTPAACRGLFRCLCCKTNPERLPIARLLNHLRYFHAPDLIEGRSENGSYLQAWQFPTTPGRMVTAVRVHDMGIFFLVIEITHESVHAWMSMAAAPWVALEFSYSFTLSGNDREAIFSDCVWSVRSCEGSLKRQGRCLSVSGVDAGALLAPAAMSGKLSVRRTPRELQPRAAQPRAVLRVANRSDVRAAPAVDFATFLQALHDEDELVLGAYATLDRDADALARSEAEVRARLESAPASPSAADAPAPRPEEPRPAPEVAAGAENAERRLSRNARRRMRQRLRQAFESQADSPPADGGVPASDRTVGVPARPVNARTADVARPGNRNVAGRTRNDRLANNAARLTDDVRESARISRAPEGLNPADLGRASDGQSSSVPARVSNGPSVANAVRFDSNTLVDVDIQNLAATIRREFAASSGPPAAPPPALPTSGGPSSDRPANGNARNKKKRRQRR